LIGDILGLMLSLFPKASIPPLIFLGINIIVIYFASINIIFEKKYRILYEPENILLEHTYHINALSVSPNEKYLASCGGDQYAILWDIDTRKVLFRIQHDSWVANVAFSPENKFLYTLTGKNGTIAQWNIKTRKQIFEKTWHKGQETRGFAVSKTGKRAVISCKDGTFNYFNPNDSKFYSMKIKISDVELRKVCISKKTIIAAADSKGQIFLVDINNSENILFDVIYQDVDEEMIRGLSFNSSNTLLAFTDSGGYLKILNLQSKNVISVKAHNGHAIAVVFSSNDKFIATGGQDNKICIWNLDEDKIIKSFEIQGHSNDVTSLVFLNDTRLISASRDSSIKIWNLSGLH
jgi:WD40 repeat protein